MPQVMEVDEDDVRLKFTTQGSSTCIYSWPSKEDIWLSKNDIICKLSKPQLLPGRGIRLNFSQTEIETAKQYLN